MRTPILLITLLAALSLRGETITFQWNANPEPDVAGYILDWSKNIGATNLTHRGQAGASWQGSWTNSSGRFSTNMTISIAGTNLVGINVFRLTAYTSAGLASDLSNSLIASKPTAPTGERIGTVTIQSTTNLMAWVTEDVIPFNMLPVTDNQKFWRARVDVKQGNPAALLNIPTPPTP